MPMAKILFRIGEFSATGTISALSKSAMTLPACDGPADRHADSSPALDDRYSPPRVALIAREAADFIAQPLLSPLDYINASLSP